MKKVWIIVLVLIIVLGAGMFLTWKYWPVDFERFEYQHRIYRLSLSPAMTEQELKENSLGEIVPSGVYIHGREIYIGTVQIPDAADTIIFLRRKDSALFDIYELLGGP